MNTFWLDVADMVARVTAADVAAVRAEIARLQFVAGVMEAWLRDNPAPPVPRPAPAPPPPTETPYPPPPAREPAVVTHEPRPGRPEAGRQKIPGVTREERLSNGLEIVARLLARKPAGMCRGVIHRATRVQGKLLNSILARGVVTGRLVTAGEGGATVYRLAEPPQGGG